MVTKRAWLDEGLRVLGEGGVDALRIERLTESLGVSKGSFYHHFGQGMPSYQRELLAHFEEQYTSRYIDAVESQDDRTPDEKLQVLRRIVIEDEDEQPQLEASIRSWAAHDSAARRTLERVDATRIDYLRTLWEAISDDAEQALPMARLLYVVLIGAQHVLPQLTPKDIDQLYDIVLGPTVKEQP